MLILPFTYRKQRFLSNVGHFVGIDALAGNKATVADIASGLSKLRRSKVLAWLCSISGFVSETGINDHSAQVRLASELLPDELFQAYQNLLREEQQDIGMPASLFHLQQVWFMFQMAVVCCREHTPDVPEDEFKRAMGPLCVMANGILQEIDSQIRPSQPEDDQLNEWCIGTFLPLNEVYFDDEVLPRSHRLWFECPSSDHVVSHATEMGISPDLENVFLSKYGIPLDEFFLFLFALRVEFQGSRLRNPAKPYLLDVSQRLAGIFDPGFLNQALPLISQTPEALSVRLLANRQSWSSDISPLRQFPLIQVFEGKLACPDVFLLQRAVSDRVFTLLEGAYPPGKFRELFGFIFEEAISRLIGEFATPSELSASRFLRGPKFQGTQAEAGDSIISSTDIAVVMELKASRLTTRQKYGGDTDELVQAIKDFMGSERKKKGAWQLARVFEGLLNGQCVCAPGVPPLNLSPSRLFYPIIVVAEETLGMNYVRNVIQKEFDAFLAQRTVNPTHQVPLMILTLRDIECLQAAARTRTVADVLARYARHIKDHGANPFGSFREFLHIEKIDVNRADSSNKSIMEHYTKLIMERAEKLGPADSSGS